MATRIGPKTRLSRRVGTKLFPKDEKILTKRNFPPGMHSKARRRVSDYGSQLLEKQKAKWMYGLFERQFRKYYLRAARRPGETGTLLMRYLELRLDNVVYRLGLAQTRAQARQMVSHGFIQVNGKSVNIPSYEVKVADTISVRGNKENKKLVQMIKAMIVKHKPVEWLQLDTKSLSGKVIDLPDEDSAEKIINPQLIIEHYSR